MKKNIFKFLLTGLILGFTFWYGYSFAVALYEHEFVDLFSNDFPKCLKAIEDVDKKSEIHKEFCDDLMAHKYSVYEPSFPSIQEVMFDVSQKL